MKKIKTTDAVGIALCHDITQIVPGGFKGVAFEKGHIIQEEDVTVLLSLGKDHIFIWEGAEGFLHENDAAMRLAPLVCGEGLKATPIKEGKIEFVAAYDGVLKIEVEALIAINRIEDVLVSTRYTDIFVKKGDKVAATKVIPLLVSMERIIEAEALIQKPLVSVIKAEPKKVTIITTGNEVFYGRIQDGFEPVLQEKMKQYGCEIIGRTVLPDNMEEITAQILRDKENGAELILCTGGMSVDPDDVTPTAIKNTGAEIIRYGTPVLPGAMFLVAYAEDVAIMGLPGSVMFSPKTVFDLLLPRVLIGEKITTEVIAQCAHGGLL